jgi:hypothetical protein
MPASRKALLVGAGLTLVVLVALLATAFGGGGGGAPGY